MRERGYLAFRRESATLILPYHVHKTSIYPQEVHITYSSVRIKCAVLPFFLWIKGGANFEPTTPIHKKHEILRRIVYSPVAFTNRIAF